VHGGDRWAARDRAGVLRLQARTLFAGQLTRPVQIVPRGYARIAGAHLRPHGGYDLLRVPQSRYRDQVVDLKAIDHGLATALEKRVARLGDARAMVDALAATLVARALRLPGARSGQAAPGDASAAATTAVSIALTLKGMISVGDLARAVHVSTRQLERLFHERVGISPKQFVRIVRFQEVLRATRSGPDTLRRRAGLAGWAAVALEHGFYDQAHFINDFKAFVGRTPGEWKISDDSLAAIFSAVRRPCSRGFVHGGSSREFHTEVPRASSSEQPRRTDMNYVTNPREGTLVKEPS
jgi:AraC-like DNA-binding protein